VEIDLNPGTLSGRSSFVDLRGNLSKGCIDEHERVSPKRTALPRRARQMTLPENRAIMIDLATRWMRLAERSEATRPVQQQQQVQPKDYKKDKK